MSGILGVGHAPDGGRRPKTERNGTDGVIAEEVIEEGRVEVESVLTTFAKLRVLKVGFSLRKINFACGLETLDLA